MSPCINDDTLWPHAGPATFAAVGSTETVASGQLGFGLVTSYLSRPIVLNVPAPGPGGSAQYAVNDQVNGTFLWAYGATDRLELDFALPLTFGQGGAGLEPITGGSSLHDTAERDLRFGFAYAIVPHGRVDPDAPSVSGLGTYGAWGLAARFEVSAPSGDHDQFASDGAAVFVPSVAADFHLDRFTAGAEVGTRIRPIDELLGARVGTQIVTAIGVGFDFLPRQLMTATLEGWALPTLAGQESLTGGTTTPLVPAEWQLSARTSPLDSGDLTIQVGGGGAIPFGGDTELTRPRFRFTLGIRWAPLGRASNAAASVGPAAPVSASGPETQ